MRKMCRFIFILCLSVIFLYLPAHTQSRETGAIEGTVKTETGEPLVSADITLSSPNLIGGGQQTVTNAKGRYRFSALPPGTYLVTASHDGFSTAKKTGIRLKIGTTLTVDFSMELGKIEMTIEVKGVPALIDVKDSQTATSHMANEFLKYIPSARSIRSQLKFAPGVSEESTFGASQSMSNNFMIDGVKINSPEAGEAEVDLDYDSIEEINVMGLGAPAEYGGFSGAVVNALTKTGGNNFSGMFTTFFQMNSWHSQNSDDPDFLFEGSDEEYNVHFNLGGPLAKDKAWFFTSGKYEFQKQHYEEYDGPKMSEGAFRFMGKLTWQPDRDNRLQATLEWNRRDTKNVEAGPLMDPGALVSEWRYQYFFNANYLHIFSDTTFLEAKFGGYYQRGRVDIDDPAGGPSPHIDLETEVMSGNFIEFWDFPRERYQLNAAVSHHADDFIKGSHDFKFGIELEISPLENNRGYPGGRLYYDLEGESYLMIAYDGYRAEPTTTRFSAFIQDTWSISDRLTINPGVRVNYWKGALPDQGTVFEPRIGIAPRIGLTFDIFGDHSTAFKAHYGKYYHGLMGMFYLHMQPQGTYAEYFWEDGEWVLDFEDPWEDEYTVDPDLKMAYMNQWVIGIERELAEDISVGVSYIYRTNHDFIDRVNLTGEWETVQWTSPYNGQTYTVYERLNPGDNQYYITNPKAGEDYGATFPGIVGFTPSRKYRGLEFTFNKRYSHGWQLQASYVLSKAWGTDDNTWGEFAERRTSSLGGSTIFGNPNNQLNAEGRLGIDPTHMLKVSGSFQIPKIDLSLGFYYSYTTGNTYNRNMLLPDDIDPDNSAMFGGEVYILADALGSYRYPAQHNLDIRLEKFFNFGNIKIGAVLDIFNALNAGTVTGVQTNENPWSDYEFGYVMGIRRPRTFRAGLRVEF